MIRERERNGIPGLPMVAVAIGIAVIVVWLFATFVQGADAGDPRPVLLILVVLLSALNILLMRGLFMVSPKVPGLRWANPFYTRRKISIRVRNFESGKLKVNDAEGNPIEIAAVVVWRVVETAEATFEVDDYQNYVRVQTESALRNAATSYPYDSHEDAVVSLRGNTAVVADHLQKEVQGRLNKAGVEALEARISHLAYAPEIAAAMLQRQQAGAIIAARSRIVEGAVGMVEMALQMLSHKGIVTLDEERKAAMVSNLLVVLCGEKGAQPIVNTGTIHQ
jgi:regulator of protease activity HflC (stomatin/prohibitin superfamily)